MGFMRNWLAGGWGRKLFCGGIVYLLLSLLLFWIVGEDWSRTVVETEAVNSDLLLPDLADGAEIEQTFTVQPEVLCFLQVRAERPESDPEGASVRLEYQILEGERVLLTGECSLRDAAEDGMVPLSMEGLPAGLKGKRLTLRIRGDGEGALWAGTTRSAGKYAVRAEIREELRVNGDPARGELVLRQFGYSGMPYARYYWPVCLGLGALLAAVAVYAHLHRKKGNLTALNRAADLIRQYQYLLKTLVMRDFKVRYKASVLGVLWSFLNPLLMTFVYYFVFSTIFRSSIPHFPVYLMSGIVLYNYFTEATNMGMQSIVGNAGLITKVYMPKYIFPISKAISSAINLVISMIPLLIMMIITGVPFHKSLLLLPIVIFYLVIFCVGVSLILSAALVYFRDVQFIWGILLTILNFFSPIFYPESIIPAHFITFYHFNPLYQYLFFMRTIVIGGISPTPVTYLYCFLASFGALGLGLFIFRKAQTQFVLHL